jgi:GTP-binding protein LepA
MRSENIRNFVIIAHIDHGKSTLADRFLEITGTVEARRMKVQYLDQLDLERERGITIKMAPVRMDYAVHGKQYILNLIDTPGHSDFHYEVSRALAAVEGAILLVDGTQGVQAQTLANFRAAQMAGLKVIGAVNKIDVFEDMHDERLKTAVRDLAELLDVPREEIHLVSGKVGTGAEKLLEAVVTKVPPPRGLAERAEIPRAVIFDSFYDNHKGVVASVRIFNGTIDKENSIDLIATSTHSKIKEIGFFKPQLKAMDELKEGEIGYIATGIKDPEKIKIGDTIVVSRPEYESRLDQFAFPGYKVPKPVVFVSFYPEESDDYEGLRNGLQKLKLNDSALSIEPDQNEVLGRGYKVGFLGRLHFEITSERLKREFEIPTVNTFPSVLYKVKTKKGWIEIVKPEELPQEYEEIWEPIIDIEIIVPERYVASLYSLQNMFRMRNITTHSFHERIKITARMPLVELVSDFDDKIKSMTEGYASFSYELADYEKADVSRVDVVVAGDLVPGLSRFFPKATAEREARIAVERLKEFLPRQQFAQSLQAVVQGRVIAREDIPAMKKQLGNFGKNGGDRTRKMKLWKKQARGKKRLKERGGAKISPETFKELLKR